MVDADGPLSRYHLHVAEQVDGKTRFQTQEADTESEAASAALARRGFVVWLYQHDHAATTTAYREVGMFIGERFLAIRRDTRADNGHEMR